MSLFEGLRAFIATAESGSFTEAGQRLGISNRLISKYVGEFEKRIGTRLLQRTTRKVGLTPAGQDLLNRSASLLKQLDGVIETVSEESKNVSGSLRVSAPVTFSENYIRGLIYRFSKVHPNLTIDLRVSDELVDLASESFDLAFQVTHPENHSLKVRKLGNIHSYIVASPKYLETTTTPITPEELVDHTCIIDTNRKNCSKWIFYQGEKKISVPISKSYMVNNAKIALDWALDGLGITICPSFVLSDEFKRGLLVPLFQNYSISSHPINAVYLDGKVLSRNVRALIDFTVEDIKFNYRNF